MGVRSGTIHVRMKFIPCTDVDLEEFSVGSDISGDVAMRFAGQKSAWAAAGAAKARTFMRNTIARRETLAGLTTTKPAGTTGTTVEDDDDKSAPPTLSEFLNAPPGPFGHSKDILSPGLPTTLAQHCTPVETSAFTNASNAPDKPPTSTIAMPAPQDSSSDCNSAPAECPILAAPMQPKPRTKHVTVSDDTPTTLTYVVPELVKTNSNLSAASSETSDSSVPISTGASLATLYSVQCPTLSTELDHVHSGSTFTPHAPPPNTYVRLSTEFSDLDSIPPNPYIIQMTDKSPPTQTHMKQLSSMAFETTTIVLGDGSAPSAQSGVRHSKYHHLEDASVSLDDGYDHRVSLQISKSSDAFILQNQDGDAFEVYSCNSSLDSG